MLRVIAVESAEAAVLSGRPVNREDEMPIEIEQIEAIFRYPVKSMRGEPLEAPTLGWHGLDGDKRLAYRRLEVSGGSPWLTAGKLPDLINFTPQRRQDGNAEALPTHGCTPEGEEIRGFGVLRREEVRALGSPLPAIAHTHERVP